MTMPKRPPSHHFLGADVRRTHLRMGAALVLLLVVLCFLNRFVSRDVPVAAPSILIALLLLQTVTVASWPREPPDGLVALGIAADICGVTVGIHFGGGVDMVSGPLLYVAIVGLAGLLLSERAAFLASGASGLAYGLLVWVEYRGWLAHRVAYTRPPDRQVTTVAMVMLCLFLVAWIVMYALRQLRAQYRRAEELRTEAVSALSHDLKNPLAIIHGYAQMAEEATAEDRRDMLRRIRSSTQDALDLVANVLDAAATDIRPLAVDRVPVRLNEIVEQLAEVHRVTAESRGVRLQTALAAGLPALDADPRLLRRAIANLLSNALKYTQRDGTVQVTTAAGDDAVTVTVRDTGCGIHAAALCRLFQKYSRVSSGQATEGTGLGLYIVRCIAEAHGGSVSVNSEIGRGSVFTLRLPARA